MLRRIAGLENVTADAIPIGEQDMIRLPPARGEGAWTPATRSRVFVLSVKPTYVACRLGSVSCRWSNVLRPLVVPNPVGGRPLTVGLAIFGAPESGVDWSIITAATVMTIAPLLVAFRLFQRQFIQSFMRVGIR